MKLNEKIAYYRRKAKLSQEELAALTGVSRQAVSKWELGEAAPDIGKLLALANAFGVTTDHLLNKDEEPEQPVSPPPVRETPPLPRRLRLRRGPASPASWGGWSGGGAGWPGCTSPSRGWV